MKQSIDFLAIDVHMPYEKWACILLYIAYLFLILFDSKEQTGSCNYMPLYLEHA
jgi:hypothetical protein